MEIITKKTIEDWLSIRKEEGLKIDPKTAEVEWCYAQVLGPYGIHPDFLDEWFCVGRACFARRPHSEIWVYFDDLPEETSEALWQGHKSKLAFPAGFDGFECLLGEPEPIMKSPVHVNCTIKHETQKAILVCVGDQEVWLPKSRIQLDKLPDGTAEILVPEWLADERGLI